MATWRSGPRLLLWMKLFLVGAAGVVATHSAHLVMANRAAAAALLDQQEALGRDLARLVARHAIDPLLAGDRVALQELVEDAAKARDHLVAYCLVVRDGQILAGTYPGQAPASLLTLRGPGEHGPLVVRSGERRVLDLSEPILGGQLGAIRLGLDTAGVTALRRELALDLGLLAAGVIYLALLAALAVGRTIARPLEQMVEAADWFDPAKGHHQAPPAIRVAGSDEIAQLADRFNKMMRRLEASHQEQERSRQQVVETQRLAALGSLTAGVAHEVNNPLAGLKNCLRRLEKEDLPPEKRQEYLALMEEGLDRIEAVVRQLLDYGRPHPTALAPVSPRRLAADAIRFLEPLLHPRHISCELVPGADQGAEEPGPVLADRRMAGQALVNLLLNAAYVTPDGGRIRLRLARRDGFAGLAVEDDGPGIPVEQRARILDPFFSTKPEGEGTGLGLSVTRTIVDAHGGELTFDFPEGGGTVATVWLPLAPPPDDQP